MSLWSRILVFFAVKTLIVGCYSDVTDTSGFRADDVAIGQTEIFIALKKDTRDQYKIFFSTGVTSQLGYCLTPSNEECSSVQSTYQVASKVYAKNGRTILSSDITSAISGQQYLIVIAPDTNTVLAKFQIQSVSGQDVSGTDPVELGLAEIKKSTLQTELTYLASDDYNGRLAATPENDRAADWIIGELKKLNIQPLRDGDYRQKFALNVGPMSGQTSSNIVSLLPGNDPDLKDEYIIIGAHMDHAGTLNRGYTCSNGGSNQICNGADDNGSGTIAVLNIARALAKVRAHIKRSVIIMWFSGEEEGLIGSKYYVANPLVPLNQTVYMINLDMVGYLGSFGGLAALGGGTSASGRSILETLNTKYSDVSIRISDQPGGGSDHAPFMNRGIPGVFFHTGVKNNPNYHKTSDTADKIDYQGMFNATKIAFETLLHMATLSQEVADYSLVGRQPFVSEEELEQACHHLIENPFAEDIGFELDFQYGNKP